MAKSTPPLILGAFTNETKLTAAPTHVNVVDKVFKPPKTASLRCTNKSGQSICLTSQRNDWKKHEKDTEKV